MRVLAYRIQAAAFGDLDRAMLRRLREPGDGAFEPGSARPFATRGPTTREGVGLKSGALLVREWNGRLERIMVLDDGYAWNGSVYRSLSQVDHRHELERTPLLRAEGGRNGISNRKGSATRRLRLAGDFGRRTAKTVAEGPQKAGTCLFRTADLTRPESWRFFDGDGFASRSACN